MKKTVILSIILTTTVLFCACGTKKVDIATNVENVTEDKDAIEKPIADNPVNEEVTDSELVELKKNTSDMSDFEKLFAEGGKAVYDDNNLGGYIDINGDYTISPKFNEVKEFSEGLAAVRDNDSLLWGFIDKSGNYVINPQYEEVNKFYNGAAIVKPNLTHCGLINAKGEYLIEPIYREVSYYKDGYALVQWKDETTDRMIYHFVDEKGNLVFEDYDEAYLFDNGYACVRKRYMPFTRLTKNGECQDFNIDAEVWGIESLIYGEYSELNEYVELQDKTVFSTADGGKFVFYEEEIISPFFDELSGYSNGLYLAGDVDYSTGSRIVKYGFMDESFNWVIEPAYKSCGFFSGDYTWAVEDLTYEEQVTLGDDVYACWYIIDKSGNRIMDGSYKNHNNIQIRMSDMDVVNMLSLPIPACDMSTMKCGFVDRTYNVVIPFEYENISGYSRDGSYAWAQENGHWGFIDRNGHWIIEPEFKSLKNKPFM